MEPHAGSEIWDALLNGIWSILESNLSIGWVNQKEKCAEKIAYSPDL